MKQPVDVLAYLEAFASARGLDAKVLARLAATSEERLRQVLSPHLSDEEVNQIVSQLMQLKQP